MLCDDKIYILDGLTTIEIHPKLVGIYQESGSSFSTVKTCAVKFKRGIQVSFEDDPSEKRKKNDNHP